MTWGEINYQLVKRLSGVDPAVLLAELNAAYTEILDERPWKGLEASAVLQSVADYEEGTLAVSSGSAALTLTGGTFSAEMDGRKIRIANRIEFYIFTLVDADQGTLDRAYEGEDSAEAGYRIFQDEYIVGSGVKAVESIRHLQIGTELGKKTSQYLDAIDPSHQEYGEPTLWAPIEDTPEAAGAVAHAVRLWPVPIELRSFEYSFRRAAFRVEKTTASLAQSPLPFVSPHALIARVEAQLAPDAAQAKRAADKYNAQMTAMHHQENERTPPQSMGLSDRWTRVWRERGLR